MKSMENKYIIPPYDESDIVFQAAIFNTDEYEGCEKHIDWEAIKREDPNLPENAQLIFESTCGNDYQKWTDQEIQLLLEIRNKKGTMKEKLKRYFPNRSEKSCFMKLKRIADSQRRKNSNQKNQELFSSEE